MRRNGKKCRYIAHYSVKLKDGRVLESGFAHGYPEGEAEVAIVEETDIHRALIAAENRIREKYAGDKNVDEIVVWGIDNLEDDVFAGREEEEGDGAMGYCPYQE